MLKGVTAILGAAGVATTSGLYILCNAMGDGMFQYLPFFLALTATRKFKMDQFTGMALAAAMLYPTLTTTVKSSTNLFGLPISLPSGGYFQTVVPIILAVKMFAVPFFTLLISVPLSILLIGPIANTLSGWLGAAFQAVFDFSPLIFGALLGGLWQVLVMFGLHWGLVPIAMMDFSTKGWSVLLNPSIAVCFAQTGALIAVILKTKEKKVKEISIPALISSVFGVTEPAIYGVTLPMKTPYINPKTGAMGSVINLAICAVASLILGFALTMLVKIPTLYAKKEEVAPVGANVVSANAAPVVEKDKVAVKAETVAAPVSGDVLSLADVNDEVFASGAMGQGAAVNPNEGVIKAPVSGTISLVFPTGHAVGLKSDNGAEILIHVGMDTVNLEGEGFETLVQKDQHVNAGDELVKFDLEGIKAKGYDMTTPIVITNSKDYSEVKAVAQDSITAGQALLDLK